MGADLAMGTDLAPSHCEWTCRSKDWAYNDSLSISLHKALRVLLSHFPGSRASFLHCFHSVFSFQPGAWVICEKRFPVANIVFVYFSNLSSGQTNVFCYEVPRVHSHFSLPFFLSSSLPLSLPPPSFLPPHTSLSLPTPPSVPFPVFH